MRKALLSERLLTIVAAMGLALLVIAIFSVYLFKSSKKTKGQQACYSPIWSVSSNVGEAQAGVPFECRVEVDPDYTATSTVSCGVDNGTNWKETLCEDAGWDGNTKIFNCTLSDTDKDGSIQLIAAGTNLSYDEEDVCLTYPEESTVLSYYSVGDDSVQTSSGEEITDDSEEYDKTVANSEIFYKGYYESGVLNPQSRITPMVQTTTTPAPPTIIPIPTDTPVPTPTPTPTSIPLSFVFYCQGDPQWKNTCAMGLAGCGPTSTAMILSSFGKPMTPEEVDKEFRENKWRQDWTKRTGLTCGDFPSNINQERGMLQSGWLQREGFVVGPDLVINKTNLHKQTYAYQGDLDLEEAAKYISAGNLLLASSQSFPCIRCGPGGTGHIFVVEKVNERKGTVTIRDPNNCDYNTGIEYETNRERDAKSFLWYYAYPLKRVF